MKKILFITILSLLTQLLIAQNKYRCATAEEQKKVFEGNSYKGIDGYYSDSISLRQVCLTNETKKRIHDLLFVDYDFKDEIQEAVNNMKSIYEPMAKRLTIKDTTKYQAILDSLLEFERLDATMSYHSIKKDAKLIYLLGDIYYYDAIPMLKSIIKDSSRYYKSECFRLALARLGDKESHDYYIKKYQKLSISNDEFYDKERIMTYLNTQESFWLFYEELNNKDLLIDDCSECPAMNAYDYVTNRANSTIFGNSIKTKNYPKKIKDFWIEKYQLHRRKPYTFKDAQKMYNDLYYIKGQFPLDERNK